MAALTIALSSVANRLQSTDTMAEERHLGQNLVGARTTASDKRTTTVVIGRFCLATFPLAHRSMGLAEPLTKLGLGLYELLAFCLDVPWNCCHILNSVVNA